MPVSSRLSKLFRAATLALPILFACFDATAAKPPQPVKIDPARIGGSFFTDEAAIVKAQDGNTTEDVEVFLSKDQQFDAGVYRSDKVRKEITEPYGVNEYMHFLEGAVILTSSDGRVTEVKAGESVVIPAEWTGVWETEGYTKIYVIYSPDGPIEP